MREVRTHVTSVTVEARGYRNVFRIEVVGFEGTFHGVRRTMVEALATARRYAKLLDAPCRVI